MNACFNAKVWTNPLYFISSGFGSGLLPYAPGTWGTLLAVPMVWLLSLCSFTVYLLVTIGALVLGVFITDWVSQDMGEHDHASIVLDEIVGYFVTMIGTPVHVVWLVLGFLLFRLFDIWKPQPIRYLDQNIKGGLGIMLDDVLAAVFAWLILQSIVWGFS